MKDLTSGNIRSQLIRLAVPLIFGNILQQFYNTVDALVVGRYAGSVAFAAIGVSGTVMNLFVFVINGFCTGISIILAQFYGCGNRKLFCRGAFTSLVSGCVFTAVISILGLIFLMPVLRVIRTPMEVAGPACTYLSVIFCGLSAVFLYNYCSAILRAAGDTTAALLFLAVAVCVNLILDLVFVAGLDAGIAGAAWATILSQSVSVLLCLIYMKRKAPHLLPRKEDMTVDSSLLKRTWSYCSVTALHMSSVYIGKLLVQGAVNTLGTDIIAAYTATGRIEGFANSFGDSGSASMSILIAQNTGKGNHQRVKQGFITGILLLIAFGLLCSTIMYLTANASMAFMLGAREGTAFIQGTRYLQTISCFYVLCFVGNGLAGYFEGTGHVTIPMVGAAMHLTLRVILSWMFVGTAGLYAVSMATGIGWLLLVLLWGSIYIIISRKIRLSPLISTIRFFCHNNTPTGTEVPLNEKKN